MKTGRQGITRRGFLRVTTGLAVGASAGLGPGGVARMEGSDSPTTSTKSRVVLIRDPEASRKAGQVPPELLRSMLNEAMAALFDASDGPAAWGKLFSAEDIVGVKSNAWGNLPTPESLEIAIRRELVDVGVSEDHLSVDDRGVRTNRTFLQASALINVRPMRTHHWSGLGTCLKNMIMFVPRPADYHGDSCASLGAIWKLPELDGKVRLNILVMLTPQFHGVGPHSFSPRFIWPYGGLLVGTDPVAVDATGARIIEAKRREFFDEIRPISPPPHHIEIADTRYGLGNSKPADIELVLLGWKDGVLIG
jgi:hypothetical protein